MIETSSNIVDTTSDWTNEAPSPLFKSSPRPMASTVAVLNYSPAFHLIPVEEYDINTMPLASFGFLSCSAVVVKNTESAVKNRALGHIFHGFRGQDLDVDEYALGIVELFGLQTKKLVAAVISFGKSRKLEESLEKHGIAVIKKLEIRQDDSMFGHERDVLVFPDREQIVVNVRSTGIEIINF